MEKFRETTIDIQTNKSFVLFPGSCPANLQTESPIPPQSYVVNPDTGTIFTCGLNGVG